MILIVFKVCFNCFVSVSVKTLFSCFGLVVFQLRHRESYIRVVFWLFWLFVSCDLKTLFHFRKLFCFGFSYVTSFSLRSVH